MSTITYEPGVSRELEEAAGIKDDQALKADIEVTKFVLDVVRRGVPDIDVAESIIQADVNRTIEGASTLNVTVHDHAREILNSKALQTEDGRLLTSDVELDGLWFRLAKVRKAGDDLELAFEDREVALLRAKKGARKASRGKVTRAEFVLMLVRSVKSYTIRFHAPELRKRQPIGRPKKQSQASRDRRRSKGFADGVKLRGKEGTLSRGQLANASRALARADERTKLDRPKLALICAILIEAPDFKNPTGGEGSSVGILQVTSSTAASRGIRNRRNIEEVVDQFLLRGFATGKGAIQLARENPGWSVGRIAQAVQGSAHPSRYDKVRGLARDILKAWSGGGPGGSSGGSYHKRYEFRVNKGENYWDAIQRLASEVGWRAFMVAGTLYYMSEEDLMRSRARYRFSERSPGINNIDFDWDRGKKVARATVACRISRWKAPPGTVVIMEDVGAASGRWLVETIDRSLYSAEATITLKTPMPELPEPRSERVSRTPRGGSERGAGGGGGINRMGGAQGIVDDAVRIAIDAGGAGVYVGSRLRKGATTTSGRPSDHAQNNARVSAADIGVRGINLLSGPPSPKLDRAVVAIGKEFGRSYGNGKRAIIDTFNWKGYRIQIIWRTPAYGDHRGHIHIGARRL